MKNLPPESKAVVGDFCSKFLLDPVDMERRVLSAIAHYKGDASCPDVEALKDAWYGPLRERGEALYELYDSDQIFCEMVACFEVYSRHYVKQLSTLDIKPDSILDLGCGLGQTTQALTDQFDCLVTGTNLITSRQFTFCLSQGLSVVADHASVGPVDMVFASEYFEHVYNAGDHLLDVIEKNEPKMIVMANAFNAESMGHFDYFFNGTFASKAYPAETMIPCKSMGRLFAQILRAEGYQKTDTGFWNSRPNVWIK